MIRIPKLPLAALAVALTLSACDSSRSSFVGSYYASYHIGVGRTVASEGPTPVTLTGSPFPDADVVAAMNALPNIYGIKFTTDQKPGRSGYRIALNFGTNQPNSCTPNTTTSVPFPTGPLALSAGFCRYGGELTRTTGRTPLPARADSPEFQIFLRNLILELLPPYQPYPTDSSSCGGRIC